MSPQKEFLVSPSDTSPPASTGPDPASHSERRITRRRFAGLAGATLAAGLAPAGTQAYAAGGRGFKARPRRWRAPRPPHLPGGFTRTFSSRFIDAGGLRQHAVIGGDGPPLLLRPDRSRMEGNRQEEGPRDGNRPDDDRPEGKR